MENVIISDEDGFSKLKQKFYSGGLDKVHVVSDFDNTLTRAFVGGERVRSMISILRDENYLSPAYSKAAEDLFEKFHPYEKDPTISEKERAEKMFEWWIAHFNLLISEGIRKEDLQKVVESGFVEFREGYKEFFRFLHEHNVPLVIISSSGLGDAIEMYLSKNGVMYNNITIVTNSFVWDEGGIATDVKYPIIHSANKGEVAIDNLPIYYELLKRKNVLLLGDSKTDLKMVEGFPYENLITVGFLNDKVDELLEVYEDSYDVVITGDGSLDFVNQFFDLF